MPRYIRWDHTESKFVVDLPTGTVSCTKSAQVSTVNKFRDALSRLIPYMRENDTSDAARSLQLAQEYASLVKFAHENAPDIFNAPNLDIGNVLEDYSELAYCMACMDKLPTIHDEEILHGPLKRDYSIKSYPDIHAVAIWKRSSDTTRVILMDDKYTSLVNNLPTPDVSTSTPLMVATARLQQLFPANVTSDDVKSKRKFPLKNIVWSWILGLELPDDYTVVPLNYQQYDLREQNLLLLPGGPKNHKSIVDVPRVPTEIETTLGFRFWPRNVVLYAPANNTDSMWTFVIKTPSGKKKGTCSMATVVDKYTKFVVPVLMDADANFHTTNAKYQRLLEEFMAVSQSSGLMAQ